MTKVLRLLMALALAALVLCACTAKWQGGQVGTSRRPLDSRPELGWPLGYAADFVATDTRVPSKNCSGRIYVNSLQEPRGAPIEKLCAGRKRVTIWQQKGNFVFAVLDPEAKVYWTKETSDQARLDAGSSDKGRMVTLNGRPVRYYEETRQQSDGRSELARVWEDVRGIGKYGYVTFLVYDP